MTKSGSKLVFDENKDWCSLSPDNLFGYYLGYACYQHDEGLMHIDSYIEYKKIKDNDKLFLKNLKEDSNFIIAYIYYYAVRIAGIYRYLKLRWLKGKR